MATTQSLAGYCIEYGMFIARSLFLRSWNCNRCSWISPEKSGYRDTRWPFTDRSPFSGQLGERRPGHGNWAGLDEVAQSWCSLAPFQWGTPCLSCLTWNLSQRSEIHSRKDPWCSSLCELCWVFPIHINGTQNEFVFWCWIGHWIHFHFRVKNCRTNISLNRVQTAFFGAVQFHADST